MTDNIIKSGVFIEGVEVTSEHIGKKILVTITDDVHNFPEGFITGVVDVEPDVVTITDNDGDKASIWHYDEGIEFQWQSTHTKKKAPKTTVVQRKSLTKVVRKAEKELLRAISACKEVGIEVDYTLNIEMVYQLPKEVY